jgi:tellurite resistance protein TerC
MWAALVATILAATGADLFAHRSNHADQGNGALRWSLLWIAVAVGFAAFVATVLGASAGEEFVSAYLLEKSLSADNLMVFLLIFEQLAVPVEHQRRVLFWGIGGALVTRAAFIGAGVAALRRWHFVLYGLGALLIAFGLRLLRAVKAEPGEPPILRWLRARIPLSAGDESHGFVVREGRRWRLTRLSVALVAIELSDIAFSIDSVPSAFAVSNSPFVLYSANVLAVLGLRSLYVVLARGLSRIRYLRYGLAAVLVLAGAKLVASGWVQVPALVSLLVVAACLSVTCVVSVLRPPRSERDHP